MLDLLVILFLLSLFGLLFGLINPKFVIHWGESRKRGQVWLIYGIGTVFFFTLIGIFAPDSSSTSGHEKKQTIAGTIKDTIIPGNAVSDKHHNYIILYELPGQYTTYHIKAESMDRDYLIGVIREFRDQYEHSSLEGFQIYFYPPEFSGEAGSMPAEPSFFANYGCNFGNGYSKLIFTETGEVIRIG